MNLKRVTVFGAASTTNKEEYEVAERLGRILVERLECDLVVTGGYMGTMEAVSKGANQAAAGKCVVEGVIASSVFASRGKNGNAYLTKTTDSATLHERLDILTSRADFFVVLPGHIGTLTELSLVWTLAGIANLSSKPTKPKPIICFRDPWEKYVKDTVATLGMNKSDHSVIGTQSIYFIDDEDDIEPLIFQLRRNVNVQSSNSKL